MLRMDSRTSTPQNTLSSELLSVINQRNILTAKSRAKVLNALDKQIEGNKKVRQSDLRSKVVEEIHSSESSYLHQLQLIIKYFKEPLESSDLIPPAVQKTLFGNIEAIFQVNSELASQLNTQRDNVGRVFLNLAPYFKVYSMYAYEYKNGLNLLENLSKNNSKLSMWMKGQETRPEVGSKLSALLIAPIQRLPRYRLLLRQLLSLTPTLHPHHTTLVEAVREVEKATAHIESLVSEHELHSRQVTLQRCLVNQKPAIIGPNKRLLKEGMIMKMSANGQRAQKRYFILLSDSLLYCKLLTWDKDSVPVELGSLQCCCELPISKCVVDSVLGNGGVFNLTCRGETYILFSQHRDDALQWVDEIKSAVKQYQDNLKTLRKKSSSRHPLHLNRKRKLNKEPEPAKEEGRPSKKAKTEFPNTQGKENTIENKVPSVAVNNQNYLQTIKGLFQTFGESVRRYLYPGPIAR